MNNEKPFRQKGGGGYFLYSWIAELGPDEPMLLLKGGSNRKGPLWARIGGQISVFMLGKKAPRDPLRDERRD